MAHQESANLADVFSVQAVNIIPDVLIRRGDQVVAVVDAKYKKGADAYRNYDIYQMVAYGVALNCSSCYLIYPSSECEIDGTVHIKNSTIRIGVKAVDISGRLCVEMTEAVARDILLRYAHEAVQAIRATS